MCDMNKQMNEGFRNEPRGCRGPHEGCEGGRHHHRPMAEEEYLALDADGKLGVLLHELHHLSRAFFGGRMGQHRILRMLEEEGSMTQSVLTEKLGVRPGSASEVIGKLERAGLVTRTESAEDRRTADVNITESGRQLLSERERRRPEMFSVLTEEEKAQLTALLEKLRDDWRGKARGEHRCGGRCGHEGE